MVDSDDRYPAVRPALTGPPSMLPWNSVSDAVDGVQRGGVPRTVS